MFVKKEYDFNDLLNNSQSGAVSVLKEIENQDREDEAMRIIEDVFFDEIPTDTMVNDFIWFDLADMLGLYEENNNNEEEEE